jgi:ABC-type amino acid transport substrate-binding protein
MKKLFFACLLFNLVAVDLASARELITVAAFNYPPIYQDDVDKGLSCDLVIEAFKAVDIDVDLQFFPVKRMVENVSSGKTVCGIGGNILFSTPGIAEHITLSEPIQYVSQVFIYNKKKYPAGINFSNITDMKNYSIGVLNGSGAMNFLENYKELNLITNVTHSGSAKQLQIGRIDVWAIVDLTGIMYIKKLFPAEYMDYNHTKSFNIGDVSVAFSKKMDPNNTYNKKFKDGLNIIKKNGTYINIMAKYYGGKSAINKEALTADMR